MGWLHDLSAWLLGFADSGWALAVLAISTFTESIFNPIPPDALLIAVAIPQPHNAIWLSLLVIAASLAGAFVGHWLGKTIGRPLAIRLFPIKYVTRTEALFERYGVWAVLVAAFTPIPFKVFAILAGVLEFDRKTFLIASLIGRGARFLLIGALIMVFGKEIEDFISSHIEILTWSVGGGILAAVTGFLMYRIYQSRHSVRDMPEDKR